MGVDIEREFERARNCISSAFIGVDTETHDKVLKEFASALNEFERAAWNRGLDLGSRIEHTAALQAVGSAFLDLLGKDAGDGAINLGAGGTWYWVGEDGNNGRWSQQLP